MMWLRVTSLLICKNWSTQLEATEYCWYHMTGASMEV